MQETGFDSWVKNIPWRRKWHHAPDCLSRKSHGQRSLVGYTSRGGEEWDTIQWLSINSNYNDSNVCVQDSTPIMWRDFLTHGDSGEVGVASAGISGAVFCITLLHTCFCFMEDSSSSLWTDPRRAADGQPRVNKLGFCEFEEVQLLYSQSPDTLSYDISNKTSKQTQ